MIINISQQQLILISELQEKHQYTVIDFLITQNSGKEVLIQRRSKSRNLFPLRWEIPGGHLEHGESVFSCLKRELNEETSLDLISVDELVHHFVWTDKDVINFVFLITVSGDFVPEKEKICEFKWITNEFFHSFKHDPFMDFNIRESLEVYFSKKKHIDL